MGRPAGIMKTRKVRVWLIFYKIFLHYNCIVLHCVEHSYIVLQFFHIIGIYMWSLCGRHIRPSCTVYCSIRISFDWLSTEIGK